MNKLLVGLLMLLCSLGAAAADLKVAVYANGDITLNGKPISLDKLAKSFKTPDATVWYYREAAGDEPHPNAMEVMKLVVDNKIPITLSTKPDFSTVVDENGNVKVRK